MKINFDNKANSPKGLPSRVIRGDFESMMKMRKQHLPHVQESVQEILQDYDGSMIAIIRIREDENGDPETTDVFLGGVSNLPSQLQLGKGLANSADRFREELMEACKGDHKAMVAMAVAAVEDILKDAAKAKEKK